MSRTQFILGVALLCVSGTLAFFISFREQENKQARTMEDDAVKNHPIQVSQRSDQSSVLPLSKRKVERIDTTKYEISVNKRELQEAGKKVERETREQLREMTSRYQLTANQRREIFPLLVSHHSDFQKGFIVNGFTARTPGDANLAGEIYPILDPAQQEAYQEELLADTEWWSEIIGQLREDLDGAIDSGEIEVVTETVDTSPASSNPGRSDGKEVENDGVDLNDFFND